MHICFESHTDKASNSGSDRPVLLADLMLMHTGPCDSMYQETHCDSMYQETDCDSTYQDTDCDSMYQETDCDSMYQDTDCAKLAISAFG